MKASKSSHIKKEKETSKEVYFHPSSKPVLTQSKIHTLKELTADKESYLIISELQEITGFNLNFMAENIFEMTPKTLSSYKEKGKYFPKRSVENSIKLKELYHKGINIFGSRETFNKWLSTESYGLNNIVPLTILGYITGIDLIYEELIRIEFGATA